MGQKFRIQVQIQYIWIHNTVFINSALIFMIRPQKMQYRNLYKKPAVAEAPDLN